MCRAILSALFLTCIGATVLAAPKQSPLGRKVESFQLLDYRGKEHALGDFQEYRVLVVTFLGTECPLAKLYGTRLTKLASEYESQGVGFIGINSNSQDSITEIAAYARRQKIKFPLLKDLGNHVAEQFGASRTPEVFVLDRQRVVRYYGRIDDQYGVGYVRDHPQEDYLEIAINKLLRGEPVSRPVVEAVGCIIGRVKQPDPNAEVTFSKQIAPILQNHCVECHREGEIAPFGLTEYDEVAGWAEMIEEVVRQRRMPPWYASPEHGEFLNDRRMSEDEKNLIYQWVEAGAPEGDPRELPQPRTWVTGWQLPREPDFVAPITDEPYTVQAEGVVEYQYFDIDPGFTEDKWVDAVEIQPGNRSVVHHVLMFATQSDNVERDIQRRFRGGAQGYDAIYIPGQRVRPYPKGVAKRFPAGSKFVFQVHYTPIGTEQLDQSRVGMVFVDPATVEYEIRTSSAVNSSLRIPPGDAQHRVEAASPRQRVDARLLSLTPHMHLRGKSFFFEAVFPDGRRQPLLDVPQYDFNWQSAYRLTEPMDLPAGTRIHCVAHFDNSDGNLANPDPTKTVRWGQQTWEEMMIGYYDYTIPKGSEPPLDKRDRREQRVTELFERLDRNMDERITRDEVPKEFQLLFYRLDSNSDDELKIEELEPLKSMQSRPRGPHR